MSTYFKPFSLIVFCELIPKVSSTVEIAIVLLAVRTLLGKIPDIQDFFATDEGKKYRG